MRTVIFGAATSLDNFLARSDGSVDWLRWGEGAAAIMKDVWSAIDTVIMGRKTYEVARGHARPEAGPKNANPIPYPGMASYVFSSTLADEPGVTVVRESAVPFVRRLKGEPGRDICVMGGGLLARPLLEAGLIDRIGFNIHPVLLGSGVPVFHPLPRQIDLELEECRPLGNGCAYVSYRVLHG